MFSEERAKAAKEKVDLIHKAKYNALSELEMSLQEKDEGFGRIPDVVWREIIRLKEQYDV